MRATWDKDALWDAVRDFLRDNPGSTVKDITAGLSSVYGQGTVLQTRVYIVLIEHMDAGEVDRMAGAGRVRYYTLRDPNAVRVIPVVLSVEEYRRLSKVARKIKVQPEEAVRILAIAGIQYMEGVR